MANLIYVLSGILIVLGLWDIVLGLWGILQGLWVLAVELPISVYRRLTWRP